MPQERRAVEAGLLGGSHVGSRRHQELARFDALGVVVRELVRQVPLPPGVPEVKLGELYERASRATVGLRRPRGPREDLATI